MSNINILQLQPVNCNKTKSEITHEELASIYGGIDERGGSGIDFLGRLLVIEEVSGIGRDLGEAFGTGVINFLNQPSEPRPPVSTQNGTIPGSSTIQEGIDFLDDPFSFGNSFG